MEAERETGFPSPAQGYEAKNIDFNKLLVRSPAATYIMEYESSSLADRGLAPGCLLVVDRSVRPKAGALAVLCHEGAFVCREMAKARGGFVFTDGVAEIGAAQAEVFGTVVGVVKVL